MSLVTDPDLLLSDSVGAEYRRAIDILLGDM